MLVHLTAQIGDWYEIDRASLIDPGQDPGGKVIFQGRGFVHKSVIGVGGLQNGAAIYADYTTKSSVVVAHAAGDQKLDVLGCFGDFVKVRVRSGVGWTKQICTNMVTTCS